MQTKSPLLPDFDYSAWFATLSEEEKKEMAFRDLIKDNRLGVAHIYAKVLLRMVEQGGSKSVFMIQDFIENDPPPAYAIAFFAQLCVEKYHSDSNRNRVALRHNKEGGTNEIKRTIQDEWLENPVRHQHGKQVAFAEVMANKYVLATETVKKYLSPKALEKRLAERLQEGASTV